MAATFDLKNKLDEGKLFDYDLIIIFPRNIGGELSSFKKHKLNQSHFVNSLLGTREIKDESGNMVTFIDEARRILRTDRCYLNPNGSENTNLKHLQKLYNECERHEDRQEKLEQKMDVMRKSLEAEYLEFTGSDEPTTQLKYCEMFAKTIAKRLQVGMEGRTAQLPNCRLQPSRHSRRCALPTAPVSVAGAPLRSVLFARARLCAQRRDLPRHAVFQVSVDVPALPRRVRACADHFRSHKLPLQLRDAEFRQELLRQLLLEVVLALLHDAGCFPHEGCSQLSQEPVDDLQSPRVCTVLRHGARVARFRSAGSVHVVLRAARCWCERLLCINAVVSALWSLFGRRVTSADVDVHRLGAAVQ
jgi:hypothetical protein